MITNIALDGSGTPGMLGAVAASTGFKPCRSNCSIVSRTTAPETRVTS
jgi:hypothetical protein